MAGEAGAPGWMRADPGGFWYVYWMRCYACGRVEQIDMSQRIGFAIHENAARAKGWARDRTKRHRGWFCPECVAAGKMKPAERSGGDGG